MPKTIFCDMDETVLNDEKVITPRTVLAIKRAHDAGHKIIFCTGSSLTQQLPRIQNIDVDYIATSNGGHIYDIKNAKTIFQTVMPKDVVKKCLDTLKPICAEVFVHVGRESYHLTRVDEPNYEGVTQIIPCARGNEDEVEKVIYKFCEQNDLWVVNEGRSSIRSGSVYCWDVVCKTVDKGKGVKRFYDILKIDRKDTVAIGDGRNDILMFEQVAYKVAMGNALVKVNDLADIVVADNNHDGVAEYLESIS